MQPTHEDEPAHIPTPKVLALAYPRACARVVANDFEPHLDYDLIVALVGVATSIIGGDGQRQGRPARCGPKHRVAKVAAAPGGRTRLLL